MDCFKEEETDYWGGDKSAAVTLWLNFFSLIYNSRRFLSSCQRFMGKVREQLYWWIVILVNHQRWYGMMIFTRLMLGNTSDASQKSNQLSTQVGKK